MKTQAPAGLDSQERHDLTRTIKHRLGEFVNEFVSLEPYWSWEADANRWTNLPAGEHMVTFPPLLEQIELAAFGVAGAANSKGSWESRPPASIDAFDVWRDITSEAAWIVDQLEGRHESIRENLALLAQRSPTLSDAGLLELERYVRYWWVSAKIVAGFEERPLSPHIRCPLCDGLETIKVRLDLTDRRGVARCSSCRETWDESNIGLLSAAIEQQAETPRQVRAPLPRIQFVFLGRTGAARLWARSMGIDPSLVYPAVLGVEPLRVLNTVPELIEHQGRLTVTEAKRIQECRDELRLLAIRVASSGGSRGYVR